MDFEKKEHRPWKTELLEATIFEAGSEPTDHLFLVPKDNINIDLDTSEALERAAQAELDRKSEEHGRLAAENRMREAIEQVHRIDQKVHQLELDNKTLESTLNELFTKNSGLEKKLSEMSSQNEKLESIIRSERELRAAAENRAKLAVEQANNTIMQVLNNQQNNTDGKLKIRMPSD